eukprot:Sspe_Gene.26737::Locus_11246_Transcript_1_1_Confidence_1.000_Length_5294::g.26737::m.26737/K11265/ADCY10; adenylate cyclase 10
MSSSEDEENSTGSILHLDLNARRRGSSATRYSEESVGKRPSARGAPSSTILVRKAVHSRRSILDEAEQISSERLVACVPQALIPKLLDNSACIQSCEETQAALLFVDISGFSVIAALMNQSATSEGAETLSHHLNQYFERLLRVIRSHGGDVIEFSGDAMLVAWLGGGKDSVPRLLMCADGLLKQVGTHTFTFSNTPMSMSIHMGAATGPVGAMVVGGTGKASHGKWRFVLTGQAVEMAGFAANLACNGKLVIDESIVAAMHNTPHQLQAVVLSKETVKGKQRAFYSFIDASTNLPGRAKAAKPNLPETAELKHSTALFVFDTLIYSISGGLSGELRTVSTVFIKLMTLDELPFVEQHAHLNTAFGIIQHQITKADGVVNKFIMDDKGIICLCLFGIPHHSHEDDVDRSLTFSLKVSKQLAKEVCPVSIGISRAKVYCGLTGSSWRHEYTVLGDGVNIAARLMQRGDEQQQAQQHRLQRKQNERQQHVMCDFDTMSRAKSSSIAFIEAPELQLKGRNERVRCFHCLREREKERFRRASKNSQGSLGSSSTHSSGEGTISSISSPLSSRTSKSSMSSTHSQIVRMARSTPSSSIGPGSPRVMSPVVPKLWRSRAHSSASSWEPTDLDLTQNITSDKGLPIFGREAEVDLLQGIVDMARESGAARARKGSPANLHIHPAKNGLPTSNSTSPRSDVLDAPAATRGSKEHVLIFTGGSQMGKTHLLQKAQELAAARSLPCLCIAGEDGLRDNYECISKTLRGIFEEVDIHLIEASCDVEDRQLLPLLHFVIRVKGLDMPDESYVNLPADEKIQLINKALFVLFRYHLGWPFVVLVDDGHCLDHATLGLLGYFLQLGTYIIITKRVGKQPNMLTRVNSFQRVTGTDFAQSRSMLNWESKSAVSSSESCMGATLTLTKNDEVMSLPSEEEVLPSEACNVVPLTPLDSTAVRSLVLHCLACADVSAEVVNILHHKSGGLPGLVKLMLTGLVQNSVVVVAPNGRGEMVKKAEVDAVLVSSVPNAEASVMRTVDQLSARAKQTLLVCAVLGESFTEKAACCCATKELGGEQCDFDTVRESLEGLVYLGLLQVFSQDGVTSLRFTSPLSRDILYRTVLMRERKRIHAVIASVLISLTHPPSSPREVAKHLLLADFPSKAIPYLTVSYQASVRAGRLLEALEFLEQLVQSIGAVEGSKGPMPSFAQKTTWGIDSSLCCYELGKLRESLSLSLSVLASCGTTFPSTAFGLRVHRMRMKLSCCSGATFPLSVTDMCVQTVALLLEIYYWLGDATMLLFTCSLISQLRLPDGIPPQLQMAVATSRYLAGKGPRPNTSLKLHSLWDVLCAFTSWRVETLLHPAIRTKLGPELNLSPLDTSPEDGNLTCLEARDAPTLMVKRPSLMNTLWGLMCCYCTLSGEGAAALKYAELMYRHAGQSDNDRWRVYAISLRSFVALNYDSGIKSRESHFPNTQWLVLADGDDIGKNMNSYDACSLDVSLTALTLGVYSLIYARLGRGDTEDDILESAEVVAREAVRSPFIGIGALLTAEALITKPPQHPRYDTVITALLASVSSLATTFPFLAPYSELLQGFDKRKRGSLGAARDHYMKAVAKSMELDLPFSVAAVRARALLLIDKATSDKDLLQYVALNRSQHDGLQKDRLRLELARSLQHSTNLMNLNHPEPFIIENVVQQLSVTVAPPADTRRSA